MGTDEEMPPDEDMPSDETGLTTSPTTGSSDQ